MIDVKNNAITIGKKIFHLTGYEVWWQGPLGLVATIEEAQALMSPEDETNILELWRAVPVAVSRGTNDQLIGHEVLP